LAEGWLLASGGLIVASDWEMTSLQRAEISGRERQQQRKGDLFSDCDEDSERSRLCVAWSEELESRYRKCSGTKIYHRSKKKK
jgi:hypothetical protein